MSRQITYDIKSHLGFVVAQCIIDFDRRDTEIITKWDTRPHQTRKDYIMELRRFYDELKKGKYKKCLELDQGPSIAITWNEGEEIMPHRRMQITDFTRGKRPKLLKHKHFDETIVVHINTPYASFGFLDKGVPTYKFVGKLEFFVQATQDLSEPLSRLISGTCIYNTNSEDLEKQLRDTNPYSSLN